MKFKKPITQKHILGCGIACLAFVMNKSYESILKHFGEEKAKIKGTYGFEIARYLRKNGFYIHY